MGSSTRTDNLAEFLVSVRIGEEGRQRARWHVLDHVGVALYAMSDKAYSSCLLNGLAATRGSGQCTVVGSAEPANAFFAALVNGSAAHSIEFDDTHEGSGTHPGAAVIPAAMAVAEQCGATGADFLDAIVVGYEAMTRVAKALNPPKHVLRGFHVTGTSGVFGAAAAAGRLLGLSPSELRSSFGTAASLAAGTMSFLQNGAWTKRLHPGWAAAHGIVSAQLAQSGFVGPADPIEGANGLLQCFGVEPHAGALSDGLKEALAIQETELKFFPTCRLTHAPLAGMIGLFETLDIAPDNIASIRIGLPEVAVEVVGRPPSLKCNPKSATDVQFSMQYTAALAATRRRVSMVDLDPSENGPVLDLARRITVEPSARATQAWPNQWLALIEVTMRDGTVHDREFASDAASSSLDEAKAMKKFADLIAGAKVANSKDLSDAILGLPGAKSLNVVSSALRQRAIGMA